MADEIESFLAIDHERSGIVTTAEALDIADRYNTSHWRGRMGAGHEEARYSIPANPKRDDDLRLSAFIARAERAFRLVKRMRLFIHNDEGVTLSDPAEFEAIDHDIAAIGLEPELPE